MANDKKDSIDQTRRKFLQTSATIAYTAPLLTTVAVSPALAQAGSGPEFGKVGKPAKAGKPAKVKKAKKAKK